MPIFFLGGLDEFVAKRDISLKDIKEQHHSEIVLTLKSFCTGGMRDRKLFDAALKAITDDGEREKFLADWDDQQRSSMNQITNRAHELACPNGGRRGVKRAVHPGVVLRDELKEKGISVTKCANDLHVDRSRVSDIVNLRRSVSVDTAIRLGQYFDVEPMFWLNLQVNYDVAKIREAEK